MSDFERSSILDFGWFRDIVMSKAGNYCSCCKTYLEHPRITQDLADTQGVPPGQGAFESKVLAHVCPYSNFAPPLQENHLFWAGTQTGSACDRDRFGLLRHIEPYWAY